MAENTSKKSNSGEVSRRKQYSAPALEKGLDILELLANEGQGLSSSEIASGLGRTVSEVFRMMAVLEQRGYIRLREDSDAYQLTLKMFSLSHKLPALARLSVVAVPIMKSLAQEIKQSCHISIYYSGRGHVVFQQDAPIDRFINVRLGAETPLLDTCSGRVLLAFSDKDRRAMMINHIPDHQRKPEEGEEEKLVKQLRRKGCERIKSRQIQGVCDIGYPIFDQFGEVAAALVVPYVVYRDSSNTITLDQAAEFTDEASRKISIGLGFTKA